MGDHTVAGFTRPANTGRSGPASFADRAAEAARLLRQRPQVSDRAVAAATGLAAGTVAAIRSRSGAPVANVRVGLDGRVRPVDATEGRRAAADYLRVNPSATLREVAGAAGISVGTARNVRDRLRRGEDAVPHRPRRSVRAAPARRPASALPRAAGNGPRAALAALRNDPALRGGQDGRLLLRLLDAHASVADWRRLADIAPSHCAELVQALAVECANGWSRLVEQLDRRRVSDRGECVRPSR